ncbi:MAG: transcription antitermination factor NusB, partial [Synechococcus sp.]|nr:transcription antitermination factor NusB [Synechococcus sp.]
MTEQQRPSPDIKDPPESPAEALAPRMAALQIMAQVLDRKNPLDAVLEDMADFVDLPSRDKAFVRRVVATALRRLGQLDDMIVRGSNRAEPPSPPSLHHLLRIAAAQIAFMNVPDYAVVDSAVRLAEAAGMARQKGFVNAVLRRIAENHRDWIARQDPARLNTPDWLMKLWIADYGLRTAAEIAAANMSEAPLDISLKNPAMMQHWSKTLEASILATGSLRLASGGLVTRLPGFDDGMWWVQDAAASLPAQLFGDVSGRRVLDMCAAPGGKTAQLLAMGAHVTALDRSTKRLQRLQENLRRLRLEDNVTIEAADAAAWQSPQPFEYILLDAPCTATGTIRRHPDVLYMKTPA